MGSPEQYMPAWMLWALLATGYLFFSYFIGSMMAKFIGPLWREAQGRDKRIELVSAAVAIFAFILSGVGLAYTIRQVDSITDRLAVLEKTTEVLKAKIEAPKP